MNHIAIMKNTWFELVKDGIKTIESRCTKNKIAPFLKCNINDIIYFKLTGKKFIFIKAIVEKIEYYQNDDCFIKLNQYKTEIGIDESYIKNLKDKNAKYLTLIFLKDIQKLKPFEFKQKGRSAWIPDFKFNI